MKKKTLTGKSVLKNQFKRSISNVLARKHSKFNTVLKMTIGLPYRGMVSPNQIGPDMAKYGGKNIGLV